MVSSNEIRDAESIEKSEDHGNDVQEDKTSKTIDKLVRTLIELLCAWSRDTQKSLSHFRNSKFRQ